MAVARVDHVRCPRAAQPPDDGSVLSIVRGKERQGTPPATTGNLSSRKWVAFEAIAERLLRPSWCVLHRAAGMDRRYGRRGGQNHPGRQTTHTKTADSTSQWRRHTEQPGIESVETLLEPEV
jgi:hypothetical protein